MILSAIHVYTNYNTIYKEETCIVITLYTVCVAIYVNKNMH